MKWLCAVAVLCVFALPAEAAAPQGRSIFRLKEKLKAAPEKGKAAEEAEASDNDAEGQGEAGSARQGEFDVLQGEEGFPRGPGEMEEPAEAAPAGALPGAPAVAEPAGSLPPYTLPRPRSRQTPAPKASPDGAAAEKAGIPPRPDLPKPFVYERAPVNQGTVTGYDAAVAPPPITIDPATPMIPPGATTAPQRPLPRLAPYGYSLPPSKKTPPASIPR